LRGADQASTLQLLGTLFSQSGSGVERRDGERRDTLGMKELERVCPSDPFDSCRWMNGGDAGIQRDAERGEGEVLGGRK